MYSIRLERVTLFKMASIGMLAVNIVAGGGGFGDNPILQKSAGIFEQEQ